jgi:8-oxo-dGTP pyrophosphatase MutT (NUDIX family)
MTPQEKLREQLLTFAEATPSRREQTQRVAELITASPRAAHRDNFDPGHLTGSAWVVDPVSSKVLLLHHAKLGRWLQPGGHADGEYDLAAVALREAREESGLSSLALQSDRIFDIDIHPIPARAHEPAHLHFDVRYVIRADSTEAPCINHESHNVAWIEVANIEQLTSDESVLRMAQIWLREG